MLRIDVKGYGTVHEGCVYLPAVNHAVRSPFMTRVLRGIINTKVTEEALKTYGRYIIEGLGLLGFAKLPSNVTFALGQLYVTVVGASNNCTCAYPSRGYSKLPC